MLKMLLDLALPLIWVIFWLLGGVWITQSAFNLRRSEQALVGISTGMILQIWLGNLFNHFLLPLYAFPLSALIIFLAGFLLLQNRSAALKTIPLSVVWIYLFLLAFLFFYLQRGLSITSDPGLLAATSKIAAGEILKGAIFPKIDLPLFIAAGVQRLADIFPWNALDLTRSLLFALAVLFASAITLRLTRSKTAAYLAAFFAAFAMGSSWLSLLVPNNDLFSALLQYYGALSFTAPIPLPPIFTATFFAPLSLTFLPDTFLYIVCTAGLLLTCKRWKQTLPAAVISIILFASILDKWDMIISFSLAWIFIIAAWVWAHHDARLPGNLKRWILIFGCAVALASIFQKDGLEAPWGASSLAPFNPTLLAAGLVQLLPILSVLPLGFFWGWRFFRANALLELAVLLSTLPGLLLSFVLFNHVPGYADSLFFSRPILLLVLFPLLAPAMIWRWASRRSQAVIIGSIIWAALTMMGGLFCFAIALTALTQSVFPPGISGLDALAYSDFWNRADIAQFDIFDPLPYRSEIIFGRQDIPVPTAPAAPYQIHALGEVSGFHYIYLDETTWSQFDSTSQANLAAPCVKWVEEYKAKHGNAFRRILDISACQK